VVERLAALPFAVVSLTPPIWLVWAYYVIVLAATWWLDQDEDVRSALRARLVAPPVRLWAPPLGLAVVAVWSAVWSQPDGRLHVAFLDVGQGDAVFITTPRGHQVLIDGGPEPDVLLRELGRRMPFWDRSLDLVILTHPHADHLTGLIPLPERFEIGAVLDNGMSASGHLGGAWAESLASLRSGGVTRILQARAGMRIQLEPGVTLHVLNPGLLRSTDAGDHSVVVRLTWQNASFLFTGDVGEDAERALQKSGQPLSSTVLKVAHHGSASSTTPAFLAAVNPQLAVISVGADNRFGHPAREVLARLSEREVLRTDERGTIEVVTDGRVLWVNADR
jgi:competence protein ComEC